MSYQEDNADLPLSWTRTSVTASRFHTLKLPLSRRTWIPCADVPQAADFASLFDDYLRGVSGGLVVQTCHLGLARWLQDQGGQAMEMGVEALLPVAREAKPSLRELARRGRRWGEIRAIEFSETARTQFAAFQKMTVHGRKPQLQFAFRTEFEPHMRGFALVDEEDKWLGAMTLSQMKPGYWHTELFLRRLDAPVGVMEALVLDVKARLHQEGMQWLSLGATPFKITAGQPSPGGKPWQLARHSWIIGWTGRLLRFGYDHEGLFRFKQKFSPDWQPLYLCGWPDLPWRVLPDLSWASRHLHLMGYAALRRMGY